MLVKEQLKNARVWTNTLQNSAPQVAAETAVGEEGESDEEVPLSQVDASSIAAQPAQLDLAHAEAAPFPLEKWMSDEKASSAPELYRTLIIRQLEFKNCDISGSIEDLEQRLIPLIRGSINEAVDAVQAVDEEEAAAAAAAAAAPPGSASAP